MHRSILLVLLVISGFVNAQPNAPKAPIWELMKYGLFVHFVYGGEYGGMTPINKNGAIPASIDEFADSFDVDKFAQDVQSMGFEYVIFTAWHANMGVLYPSKVMADYGFDQKDHYTQKRDLLGDLISALAKKGIETSIYTHVFVGHDFHPKGSGYFSYDNKQGTITQDMVNSGYVDAVNGNSTKWNDFINKVYDEMSTRYGEKVSSYWFDGTWVPSSWVDKKRLMETIRKSNKTCAFIANGDAVGHGMPYGAKEVGWGGPEDPSLGFIKEYPPVSNNDVTSWPSYRSSIAMIQGSNWWATKGGRRRYSAETIYKYSVFQASTSTSGGMSWAFSPYVDGTWEVDNLAEMQRAYNFMKSTEESIKKTRPSTSFVTPQGTKINTLTRAFVATKSPDDSLEYIHVLKAPQGRIVTLPMASDGKRFSRAELLPGNVPATLRMTSSGYELELPAGANWDTLNTVFKLHRLPETMVNIALDRPVTASSTCFGNIPGNVVSSTAASGAIWSSCLSGEGQYTGGAVPQWLTIDLGEAHRHWSLDSWKLVSANDGDGAVSAMQLQTSKDGVVWLTVDSVSDNRARVVQRTLGRIEAPRFVRIHITKASSNWDPRIKISRIELPAVRTARLYSNTEYSGVSIGLPEGRYSRQDLLARGFGDNSLSSLAVPRGWKVELYDEDGFSKLLGSFQADVASLVPSGWNDRATSIVVSAGGTVGITRRAGERLQVVNGVVWIPGGFAGVLLERDLTGRILARHPIRDGKATLAEGPGGLRVLELHGERGVVLQPTRVLVP